VRRQRFLLDEPDANFPVHFFETPDTNSAWASSAVTPALSGTKDWDLPLYRLLV